MLRLCRRIPRSTERKIVPFDNAVFEQLFAKEDANLAALAELETEISKAKKAKDKNTESRLKAKKAKLKGIEKQWLRN